MKKKCKKKNWLGQCELELIAYGLLPKKCCGEEYCYYFKLKYNSEIKKENKDKICE